MSLEELKRCAREGLPGTGLVRLPDIKCGPPIGGSYLGQPGVTPAWHRNKTRWPWVLPDGSAPAKTVKELLDPGCRLTEEGKGRLK